ncbi:hypothetical protein GCM10010106_10590 [Thermopolyspora flexuosa]|jgi:hypothetical protein|uniref:Uncharacterized protein n=1 Tax=Thermopolyspora flexuosa TaxID=103836 RepID=A0A543J0F8_9ACTN|nr:hypothetical protein [Thermopolyspora flexuosa]TQM76311.1 hypothetical protein FHX40_3044 [Thermopolyspora flexuosa]GGM66437.1 hypothetical protein GCM10010106_10590 [Thermopolyspora flexuosa]
MTEFPDEYGEILRRALRAEADSVVPSPDGLEIIRSRIAQRRGMRGVFWWRIAATAAGAVAVAASIMMLVPGLREQATPPRQGITEIGAETDAPEGASTSRPPNTRPPEVSSTETAAVLPPPSAVPTLPPARTTAPPATSASPTPSRTPSATPSKPSGCPSGGTDGSAGRTSCPTSAKPTPTPTPTPSTTAPQEPSCPADECPAPDDPLPTETPGEQPGGEPTLSNDEEQAQE